VLEVLGEGRGRDVRLARDLGGRLARGQGAQNFDLPRRQRRPRSLLGEDQSVSRVGARTMRRLPLLSTRKSWSCAGEASQSVMAVGSRSRRFFAKPGLEEPLSRVGFIELGDDYAGSSSMMPQKKNAYVFEFVVRVRRTQSGTPPRRSGRSARRTFRI
jgi:hypothetical protein